MFTTAFDASGHEADQPLMVVAGFIAPAAEWDAFSISWDERLRRDGLEYLHMREFLNWKAEERTRRALLADLMDMIKRYASRKFGVCIPVKELKAILPEEAKKEWYLTSYLLGGMFCMTKADGWAARQQIQAPLVHTFEEGDVGTGKLSDLAYKCKLPRPRFAPGKKDSISPAGNINPKFVPLQAADFLAGEIFKENKRKISGIPQRTGPRWAFSQFETMVGEITVFDAASLKGLGELLAITLASRHVAP